MDELYDILRSYRENPNSKTAGVLLTDGLIQMDREYHRMVLQKYSSITGCIGEIFATFTTPMSRYLALNVMLHHFPKNDDVQYLKSMTSFIKELHIAYRNAVASHLISKKDILDETFIYYLQNLIVTTYSKSLTDEASESIVTSCAPIVPYVGVLKTPFQVKVAKEATDVSIKPEVFDAAVSELANLFASSESIQTVLSYLDMVPSEDNALRVPAYISSPNSTKLPRAMVIFLNDLFIIRHWNNLNDEEKRNIDTLLHGDVKSFSDVMESAMALTPNSITACLESIEEDAAMMENIRSCGGTVISKLEEMPSFDLDYLMAFLMVRREFRVNHYTNSAFANLPNISSITFYRNFMIIQPSDADGKALQHLYIPIINDLAESKIQVVKFYIDRRIEILTQDQYEYDIRQTNEKPSIIPEANA